MERQDLVDSSVLSQRAAPMRRTVTVLAHPRESSGRRRRRDVLVDP
jgi:hypothetical protein